jgi:hypothetical protein
VVAKARWLMHTTGEFLLFSFVSLSAWGIVVGASRIEHQRQERRSKTRHRLRSKTR